MLQYAGDTLVDGFAGQRIQQSGWMHLPWDPDSIIQTAGPDIVTRTEPGMVLFWLHPTQEWDTLYWFSAQPGDKWSPGWQQLYPGNSDCIDSYLLVVDTSTIVVDGVPLRTLELERHLNLSEVDEVFTIMERVGSTEQYLLPDPPYICFINEALLNFSCYGDDEIRYPDSSSPCELTLTIGETAAIGPESWSVSPVPFQDRFTISSATPRNATVILLDMTGRELLAISFHGTVMEINPGRLPAGSYIMRVEDQRGNHSHKVVIKE